MRFSDDHRPPLFMELGNRDHGYDLTPNEHHQEGLEDRPSQLSLLLGATGLRALPENEEQS